MKNFILLWLVISTGTASFAQQSILTAGASATGSGGTLEYSVGQIVYHSWQGNSGYVEEGVQQPYEVLIPIGIPEIDGSTVFTVAPNPASSHIRLISDLDLKKDLTWQMHDLSGQLLNQGKISGKETIIDLQDYSAATYLLTITDDKLLLYQYKIIKK